MLTPPAGTPPRPSLTRRPGRRDVGTVRRRVHSWIRVSWHRVLLGPGTPGGPGQGFYRPVDAALAHLDVASLVEITELRPLAPSHAEVPDATSAARAGGRAIRSQRGL
jgi:hypothetical protein